MAAARSSPARSARRPAELEGGGWHRHVCPRVSCPFFRRRAQAPPPLAFGPPNSPARWRRPAGSSDPWGASQPAPTRRTGEREQLCGKLRASPGPLRSRLLAPSGPLPTREGGSFPRQANPVPAHRQEPSPERRRGRRGRAGPFRPGRGPPSPQPLGRDPPATAWRGEGGGERAAGPAAADGGSRQFWRSAGSWRGGRERTMDGKRRGAAGPPPSRLHSAQERAGRLGVSHAVSPSLPHKAAVAAAQMQCLPPSPLSSLSESLQPRGGGGSAQGARRR